MDRVNSHNRCRLQPLQPNPLEQHREYQSGVGGPTTVGSLALHKIALRVSRALLLW